MRRHRRIQNDLAALTELAVAKPNFRWRRNGRQLLLEYVNTPGLIRTGGGVEIWGRWQAALTLPPRYPIEGPIVTLSSVGRSGAPYHPNVLPVPPYLLCYGRHLPDLLLDELARRIERMIVLMQGAVATGEPYLNGDACGYVRRLIREGKTPLTPEHRTQKQPSEPSDRGVPS
jgi:hypothetical protein